MSAVPHLLRARAAVLRMPALTDADQATREVALWSLNQALAALGHAPALAPLPGIAKGRRACSPS